VRPLVAVVWSRCGLAISVPGEVPAEPQLGAFPARNRVIAGLCLATVIVEAGERSGALITADFALEAGREVFAVPGEITSTLSAGTNALLRLGATPVTSAIEIART
jgi:DNA processing protein